MLTAAQLAKAREIVGRSLVGSCQVLRRTRVDDGGGSWTDAYAVVATLACRVRPAGFLRPIEQRDERRVAAIRPTQFVLPWDADVRATDRIRYGGRDYLVHGSDAGKSDATELVVEATLVD